MMKILVIDDDSISRILLKDSLKHLGYEFLFAESGEQGIQKLEKYKNIALVLIDYQMPPGMDGLKTFKQAIEKFEKLPPFILCTADSSSQLKHAAYSYGFEEVIVKPIRPMYLINLVNSLLMPSSGNHT